MLRISTATNSINLVSQSQHCMLVNISRYMEEMFLLKYLGMHHKISRNISWNASQNILWLMFLKSLIRSPNVSASLHENIHFRLLSNVSPCLKRGKKRRKFQPIKIFGTRPDPRIVGQAFTLFWYQLPPLRLQKCLKNLERKKVGQHSIEVCLK